MLNRILFKPCKPSPSALDIYGAREVKAYTNTFQVVYGYTYLAIDRDGYVFAYQIKPYLDIDEWECKGKIIMVGKFGGKSFIHHGWKDTVVRL